MSPKRIELIAAIRKVGPTTAVPGAAHIMGNVAEFLADLAEEASQLQRKIVWLTVVLAILTAALLAFTVVLYKDTHQLIQREKLAEKSHVQNQ
jgi:hypothetical protein